MFFVLQIISYIRTDKGPMQGRPIWQKVCVVPNEFIFVVEMGYVKFVKDAKLFSTWAHTDEFHTHTAKNHHVL